jgi:hypothetical protein
VTVLRWYLLVRYVIMLVLSPNPATFSSISFTVDTQTHKRHSPSIRTGRSQTPVEVKKHERQDEKIPCKTCG